MSLKRKIAQGARRRASRVRARLTTIDGCPRVTVFRSLRHMYAQVIDDAAQKTLASCSSLELEKTGEMKLRGDKKAVAHAVGRELAKRALEKNVDAVVFDRGRFLYHGRVKSLAEGLREGGLKF
ncbi:MAG: 50S ribosomal protein L18 [Candidatus Babeliaceae bacterium]|nr:50S ribosomal protein L18 [Candidatus Babeliaceae bacterium]